MYKQLLSYVLLLSLASPILRGQSEIRRFTLEDTLAVEPIGETALSPDGKTFALARSGWRVLLTTIAGTKRGLHCSPGWTVDCLCQRRQYLDCGGVRRRGASFDIQCSGRG